MGLRVLRCGSCGFLDASTPTTAKDGEGCRNCGSDNTQAEMLRTL